MFVSHSLFRHHEVELRRCEISLHVSHSCVQDGVTLLAGVELLSQMFDMLLGLNELLVHAFVGSAGEDALVTILYAVRTWGSPSTLLRQSVKGMHCDVCGCQRLTFVFRVLHRSQALYTTFRFFFGLGGGSRAVVSRSGAAMMGLKALLLALAMSAAQQ